MAEKDSRGGRRVGAGRKKGSTTNNTGYKTGRIVISCLKEEEAIKQKAAAAGKSVSRYIVDMLMA
jgi:hypothetical protein